MLTEEKMKEMLDTDISRLKKYVNMDVTNIFKNTVIEIHTLIVRISVLLEVLQVPADLYLTLVDQLMDKLQKDYTKKGA